MVPMNRKVNACGTRKNRSECPRPKGERRNPSMGTDNSQTTTAMNGSDDLSGIRAPVCDSDGTHAASYTRVDVLVDTK